MGETRVVHDQGRRYEVGSDPSGYLVVFEVERSVSLAFTPEGARALIVALLEELDAVDG